MMKNNLVFTLALFLLACISACRQNGRTTAVGDEPIDVVFEDINLFVQSDNFAYQRWNGMYAPLGIGFLEIIAEQKPAIPLYRTSMCEVPEDSIILHQYPFDINIIELEYKAFKSRLYPEELRDFWDSIYQAHPDWWQSKEGEFYYHYTAKWDTLMPLSWKPGSDVYQFMRERHSLIYTVPTLRLRVLEMTADRFKVVLNEESGKAAWIKYTLPQQIVVYDREKPDKNFDLMRMNTMPSKKELPFDFYYISWETYLRMVLITRFDDGVEIRRPIKIQGDFIQSGKQGWKRWRDGDKLLIKSITEYYVE